MSPPQVRKDQSLTWSIIRELGGPLVVVAFIVFIVRLDSTVSTLTRAVEKFGTIIEQVTIAQRAASEQRIRDSTTVADHSRRISDLEEARRGSRR